MIDPDKLMRWPLPPVTQAYTERDSIVYALGVGAGMVDPMADLRYVYEGAPGPHPMPEDRTPDIVVDLPTRPEQAALYRLSGDLNPLHVDPEVATAAGFERPILHGLCSYGIAARAVLAQFCGNDAARLTRFDVRFASPAFPGETIRTELWRDGPGRASFRARVLERDRLVLTHCLAEFNIYR